MRNASPTTDPMVSSGISICLTVPVNTRPKRAGDMPMVLVSRRGGLHRVLAFQLESVLGAPELEQDDERSDRGERRQDIGELRSNEVRDEELGAGEGDAAQRGGGKHAFKRRPSA